MRPRMLITALIALALTSCGGNDGEPGEAAGDGTAPSPAADWEGRVEVDFETGEVTAPGFNELIDTDAPSWAEAPLSTVTALLHLDEAEGTVDTDQETSGGNPVVVTISELPDASVDAERYRVEVEEGDDGLFRFADGEWAQRCKPDRGHQEFSVDPCV